MPATITGPSAFGRMWRTTWRIFEAPAARAASTNSFSRKRQELGPHEPGDRHPAQAADHDDDHHEDAALDPEGGLQAVPEQVDDQQQERQLRQGQEQVRHPHQDRVEHAARHAGERADHDADDHGRDQHRREADRERDAAAIDHTGEEVLAEIVRAERDGPRTVPGGSPRNRCRRSRSARSAARTRPQGSGPRARTALASASLWRRNRLHVSRPLPTGSAGPLPSASAGSAATTAGSAEGDARVEPAIEEVRDRG